MGGDSIWFWREKVMSDSSGFKKWAATSSGLVGETGVGGGWEKRRSSVEVTSESIELLKPVGLVFSVKLSLSVLQ
ncbi:hypothetical protein TNCV_2649041 [Trichonephila clavipes]|nr:hypothetical protein TNCV_2649041 [Trichonephila clavipes]